jgi:Nucleotidyltransferase/DNA polymerase involved in DNA repair
VEQASIDEAYLDATGLERVFGPVEHMAAQLKQKVHETTGLTCSVGVAPVKFLAKIASDRNKPNGMTLILPEDVAAFLQTLPIGHIPGVGKKTLPAIHELGVRYAAEVARYPADFWVRRFGKMGGVLYARGCGIDPRDVIPYEPPKSESAEHTFEEDTLDRDILHAWLLRQSERIGLSLRTIGFQGRTITLKVKYSDFSGVTRARTLARPTNLTRVIFETAVALLEELAPAKKLRLIGVGVSHFGDATPETAVVREVSLSLLEEKRPKESAVNPSTVDVARESALDAALDAVRGKFGNAALVRGRLFAHTAREPDESSGTDAVEDMDRNAR